VTLVVDVPEAVISDRLRAFGPGGAGDAGGELHGRQTLRQRLYHGATIGLRCPDDPVAQRVLGAIDAPIVASSANHRGAAPPMDADEAAAAVGDAADLIVDGGRARYAKPSTIVRVTQRDGSPHIAVQREGVYDERFIRKLLRWTMVLVCSGNTCRSPMAEAIAKDVLAKQRGIAPDDLEAAGLRIVSAGVYAAPGSPPSPEAVDALAKMDIDMRPHRSRRLSLELIHEADVIYCMTRGHLEAIVEAAPYAADKTFLLDPNGDIEDPIGAGLTTYQRCAEMIRRRLDQRLKEQQP
jgi:protein-tyrosine phosphatase